MSAEKICRKQVNKFKRAEAEEGMKLQVRTHGGVTQTFHTCAAEALNPW